MAKRAHVSTDNRTSSRQLTFTSRVCLQFYVIAIVVFILGLAKHVYRSIRDCSTGGPDSVHGKKRGYEEPLESGRF